MAINMMANYGTPSKRLKLETADDENVWEAADDDFQWENLDDDDENNEKWEDLTAEEIAMADEQEKVATQRFQQGSLTDIQIPSTSGISSIILKNSFQFVEKEEDMKNQIYILEGKNKSLINSINNERTQKEVILEQLEKEQKERKLENEVFQTERELKEHAEKQYRDEIRSLKRKLENTKTNGVFKSSQQIATHSRNSKSKFITEFDKVVTVNSAVQTTSPTEKDMSQKQKYRLSLLWPKGEPNKDYVLSRFLTLQHQNILPMTCIEQSSSNVRVFDQINYMSSNLTLLNINLENENIWEEYDKILKQHLLFLQTANSANQKQELVDNVEIDSSHSSSFKILTSSQAADIDSQHSVIMQCLTDLKQLLFRNFPPHISSVPPLHPANEQANKQIIDQDLCSAPLFVDQLTQELPCLSSLITLARKETYPECYQYADDELILALGALSSWSSHHPKGSSSIFPHVYNHLPLHSYLSGQHGIPCALEALRLLINFINLKDFNQLLHQSEGCAYITVAGLCHIVRTATPEDSAAILQLVENFLSSTLAVLGNAALQNENCHCSYQIIQGFILMVYHHFKIYNNKSIMNGLQILKKGVMLLHMLSLLIHSFEKKRLPVEDEYVVLISALSRLVEKNTDLKCLNDAVQELADFNKKRDDSPDDGDDCDSDDVSVSQCHSPV